MRICSEAYVSQLPKVSTCEQESESGWHPFLLQRRSFYAFGALFGCLAIALETVLAISNRNHGLATTTQERSYLWTYGPTALLSGIAATWAYVEYTAKVAAPWIRPKKAVLSTSHTDSLLLDYISMFILTVPFKAWRNQDYAVAVGATVSHLLTAVVVLAPSLIKLTSVELSQSVSVTSRFSDSPLNLSEIGLMPVYGGIGISRYNMRFPNGTSEHLIYQTTSPSVTSVLSLHATVTGLSVDLDCQDAHINHFELGATTRPSWKFGRLLPGTCIGATPGQPGTQRFVFMFGEVDLAKYLKSNTTDETVPATMSATTNVPEWEFAQALLDAGATVSNVWGTISWEDLGSRFQDLVDLDEYSIATLGFSSQLFPEVSSMFSPSLISSSLRTYYCVHTVLLAHEALLQPTMARVPGEAFVTSDRLVVQGLACHLMAAACLLALLLLITATRSLPLNISLAGDPGTLIGVAELTRQVAPCFPRGLSSRNMDTVKDIVEDSDNWLHRGVKKPPKLHQPVILHTASRSLICLVLVAAIVSLEVLWKISKTDQGLGHALAPTYSHYLWTALPASVFKLISIAISSVDAEYRLITPYYAMSRGPTSASTSLRQKLLGLPAPLALYKQCFVSNYGGAMVAGAALVASFFSIAAGPLFFESSSFTWKAQLQLVGSFASDLYNPHYDVIFGVHSGSGIGVNDLGIISTLVLQSNLSNPAFTYEGLALPNIAWQALSTKAVIPALQSGLTCYHYKQSEITAEIRYIDPEKEPKFGDPVWPAGYRILVNVTGQHCRDGDRNGTVPDLSATAAFFINGSMTSGGVFGSAMSEYSRKNTIFNSCSAPYFYIWGSFSLDGPSNTVSASALDCNASISAIDVEVVLSGPQLAITEDKPPRRIENSEREVIPAHNSTTQFQHGVYQDLVSSRAPNGTMLSPFFSILTTSRYAIPASDLATRAKDADVIQAIKFHHNLIVAQTLSTTARQRRLNDTILATITGNPDNLPSRVLQNETVTRILEAMLATALALTVLGWYCGSRQGILPRPPTSVASVLAMLVDENFFSLFEEKPGEPAQKIFSETAKLLGDGHEYPFGIYAMDGSGLLGAEVLANEKTVASGQNQDVAEDRRES
ncbi:hypothetical protein F5Y17DRAFT_469373 [Xylariaceae sp. FL0594]|nr:hypothetical protein F5Y17DRAFT_469373 [Xylariaceae sp. FL0594]